MTNSRDHDKKEQNNENSVENQRINPIDDAIKHLETLTFKKYLVLFPKSTYQEYLIFYLKNIDQYMKERPAETAPTTSTGYLSKLLSPNTEDMGEFNRLYNNLVPFGQEEFEKPFKLAVSSNTFHELIIEAVFKHGEALIDPDGKIKDEILRTFSDVSNIDLQDIKTRLYENENNTVQKQKTEKIADQLIESGVNPYSDALTKMAGQIIRKDNTGESFTEEEENIIKLATGTNPFNPDIDPDTELPLNVRNSIPTIFPKIKYCRYQEFLSKDPLKELQTYEKHVLKVIKYFSKKANKNFKASQIQDNTEHQAKIHYKMLQQKALKGFLDSLSLDTIIEKIRHKIQLAAADKDPIPLDRFCVAQEKRQIYLYLHDFLTVNNKEIQVLNSQVNVFKNNLDKLKQQKDSLPKNTFFKPSQDTQGAIEEEINDNAEKKKLKQDTIKVMKQQNLILKDLINALTENTVTQQLIKKSFRKKINVIEKIAKKLNSNKFKSEVIEAKFKKLKRHLFNTNKFEKLTIDLDQLLFESLSNLLHDHPSKDDLITDFKSFNKQFYFNAVRYTEEYCMEKFSSKLIDWRDSILSNTNENVKKIFPIPHHHS